MGQCNMDLCIVIFILIRVQELKSLRLGYHCLVPAAKGAVGTLVLEHQFIETQYREFVLRALFSIGSTPGFRPWCVINRAITQRVLY